MADAAAAALQEERKLKFAEKERLEVEKLEHRIKEQTPARGSQLEDAANFDFFPLSEATKRGTLTHDPLAFCGWVDAQSHLLAYMNPPYRFAAK